MAETSEETQRLKRIAAAAYDYDNDSRWADYWSNILIPPNLVSRSDVIDHFKRKFYQRHIDPDLVVQTVSFSSLPSQSARQSAPSPPTNDQTQAQSSGSTTGNSGTSTTTDSNPTSQHLCLHMILFSINAWVLIVALFAMLPMVPKNLSHRAFRLSFMGTTFSSLFSLLISCGAPKALDMQALEVYFQSVVATKAFVYFIYCLTFVASNLCLKFALIPIICGTIEQIAKFLRRSFPRSLFYRKCLERPCAWVESNTTTLSLLSSNVEIALGFLLIISLFSWQRNFVLTFMYWQLLRLMYHFPMTAGYHQSGWAKVGRKVNPFVSRFLPFLKPSLSAAERWWIR
ncbi:uncharacterized protein LOC111013250 isoform X3 [Momordica charantia]|nr:uncharacterized protein LOC111013250 isoform X2 [Momordica charantia]XP_022143364.1 uncharacterized protein LOC111013250 isoform X3 [Momordica charantia]